MGPIITETKGRVPIKAWVSHVPALEPQAFEQILNTAALPFIHKHVAIMPDAHWGIGATVGSVVPTKGALVPAAVGVDIGCGMVAARTNLTADDLPDNLRDIRLQIERDIPVGFNQHNPDRIPKTVATAWISLAPGMNWLEHNVLKHKHNPMNQVGTLGGGNHFIEICLDENNRVWVMLHSGSRGIGNAIGKHFIEKARKRAETDGIKLPDSNLAWLPEGTPEFQNYVDALTWAQFYALTNREVMLELILIGLRHKLLPTIRIQETVVNCHHNYAQREEHFGEEIWVTRKGAVAARHGQLGIIPGSMGARSYIVRGKGNPDSFHSCSHGAGRLMSRGEAKRRFNLAQHIADTAHVECRKDQGVIDETPQAYKPIDLVMKSQEDLVDIVHELRQVVCVKG